MKPTYLLFILFIASSYLSLMVKAGIPPMYVPYAGLFFGLAWAVVNLAIKKRLVWKDIFSIIFFSMFGMYAAANFYVYVVMRLSQTDAFFINNLLLAINSMVGAVITLIPLYIINSNRGKEYFLWGIALAFAIGWANAYFHKGTSGGWGPEFIFISEFLFISWQVIMGGYLIWVYNRERSLEVPVPPIPVPSPNQIIS